MSQLHRTQVYIESDQIKMLKFEAERSHLAVSQLIRMAITNFLRSKEIGIDWTQDPLTKAIGRVRLDVHDASTDHDRYLYGSKKKR